MEKKDDYPATQYTPLTRRQRFGNSRFGGFYQRHKLSVIAVIMLLLLLPLLGLLALRNRHSARADWVSPTVYPSRELLKPYAIFANETDTTQPSAMDLAYGLTLTTKLTTWCHR
jgi:hypothetical protein